MRPEARTARSRVPVSSSFSAISNTANRGTRMVEERNSDARRLRIFDRALWQKASKYILSGLVVIGTGSVTIGVGLLLDRVTTSGPLVMGLGAIVALVGLIRVLIGLVRPASPENLASSEESKSPQEELHEAIFRKNVHVQEEERN
jgi:hypothetical protein